MKGYWYILSHYPQSLEEYLFIEQIPILMVLDHNTFLYADTDKTILCLDQARQYTLLSVGLKWKTAKL
jgi:hypothetical protein